MAGYWDTYKQPEDSPPKNHQLGEKGVTPAPAAAGEEVIYRCDSEYTNVARPGCIVVGPERMSNKRTLTDMAIPPQPSKGASEIEWVIPLAALVLLAVVISLVVWRDLLSRFKKPAVIGVFIIGSLCSIAATSLLAQWVSTSGFIGVGPAYGVATLLCGMSLRFVWLSIWCPKP